MKYVFLAIVVLLIVGCQNQPENSEQYLSREDKTWFAHSGCITGCWNYRDAQGIRNDSIELACLKKCDYQYYMEYDEEYSIVCVGRDGVCTE